MCAARVGLQKACGGKHIRAARVPHFHNQNRIPCLILFKFNASLVVAGARAPAATPRDISGDDGIGGNNTRGNGAGGSGNNIDSNFGNHDDGPSRSVASWLLSSLLSYLLLVLGAAVLWDAVLDIVLASQHTDTSDATVSIIIPALNEESVIAETVRHVRQDLQPMPHEVIVVDGGSTDGTVEAARRTGAKVIHSAGRGRGLQMNAGADAAVGDLLLFLHADTHLPTDAVSEVRAALSCPRTTLVGFRPLIAHHGQPSWFSTLNNLFKTWYGPLLLRPASFVRGLRCVFGDQALSCRKVDLRAVGGYRADIPFLEDAELCIALHMAGPADNTCYKGRGRVRMLLGRPATTSGRRIAAWGELRANAVFAYVSFLWLAGSSPSELHTYYKRTYGDVR